MKIKIVVALFNLLIIDSINCQTVDTPDLIKKYGYNAESYVVKTSDGYALTIHRVVPKSSKNIKKYPCLLMHGVIDSSLEFFLLEKDSLPFVLSDQGFDVYIGNARGNQYVSHDRLNRNSSEFWDFSWHEIGIYDLPPTIDFVLNNTGAEKLSYFGMYQGCTMAMVLLSMLPEYNQKVHQVHLAGPTVFMGHFPKIPFMYMAQLGVDTLTRHNMIDLKTPMTLVNPLFVNNLEIAGIHSSMIPQFLTSGGNLLDYRTDFHANKEYINYRTPYVSSKQIRHFIQSMTSGEFRQFDYGAANMIKYGTPDAPKYDLTKVTTPVFIYRGEFDRFVSQEDVDILARELPNVPYKAVLKNFNHFDYEESRQAKDELYIKVGEFMSMENHQITTTKAPVNVMDTLISSFVNIFRP